MTSPARTRVLSPEVRALLAAVAADPTAPLRIGVVGPGGHGKSTVLAELADTYRRAGITVLDTATALACAAPADAGRPGSARAGAGVVVGAGAAAGSGSLGAFGSGLTAPRVVHTPRAEATPGRPASTSAGSTSAGSDGAWPAGAGSTGAGSTGAGPDGAGLDGAGSTGAGLADARLTGAALADAGSVRAALADLGACADVAVLVDDAHQLDDDQLDRLRWLAESRVTRLAVTYRPWPRSAALAGLTEALGRSRPPLLLRPFDREQVGQVLAAAGRPADPTLVDYVHTQTGGVPGFVQRLAAAADQHALDRRHPEIPAQALASFGPDLDRLDPDVLRLLLAVEAGAARHLDLLAALLGRDVEGVTEVVQAARATGLLGADGAVLPIGLLALRTLVPAERRLAVRLRLAELQRERGGPVLSLARTLLGTGISGARAAVAFHTAAREATVEEPALAAELYAAAVQAGEPVSSVGPGWAHAAALAGDLDTALRLADQVIGGADPAGRADGAQVAAAALAHRGQLGRSAELYRWAGARPALAFATVGLIGTGDLAGADQLASASTVDGPPTLLSGAAALMAQGVRESVTGSPTTALAALMRAAALVEPAGRSVLLPDSPAALAAVVALHCGELDVAEPVLQRAVSAGTGGVLFAARHRLLLGWLAMVRGRTTVAREHLAAATKTGHPLEPRDWLFAVGLEVGLARRDSDVRALRDTWVRACEAVLRHPVDLFTLLPLGEFAIASARLRDQGRLVPHLREASALLAQLGNPALWATQVHWSGLHAAIIAEQSDVAAEHVAALAADARRSRYGSVLATAADCWLAVLAGQVDPDRVQAAAHNLHGVGLSWDGARLAGQAAIRTADRRAMVSLLECARLLQGRPATSEASSPEKRVAAVEEPAGGRLSQREREVASLVLDGLTYKQVGDRLFISAKTVEHHMARMRQRLGCSSRGELLAQLRVLTARS